MLPRRHLSEQSMEESHEINVTPFIDVMLVLLIIFMVAMPLATVDIPVNLPSATSKASSKLDKPVYLTIKEDQTLLLNNDKVKLDALTRKLDALTKKNHEARIYLRADKNVRYDAIMQAMNRLRASGYLKVALVGLEGG